MKTALVLGGTGYLGKEICKYAISTKLYEVTSISRSGKIATSGTNPSESWQHQVKWASCDIFQPEALAYFKEKNAVISTLGAFGSNEFMNKICGDANIVAMEAAEKAGVEHFVFISSSRVGSLDISPSNPMYGYFHGKWRAEQELKKIFGKNGVILRPGFIYGNREVGNGIHIPLHFIGSPLSFIATKCGTISNIIQKIPFFGEELNSFVPVESVAKIAIDSTNDSDKLNLYMPRDIRKYANIE